MAWSRRDRGIDVTVDVGSSTSSWPLLDVILVEHTGVSACLPSAFRFRRPTLLFSLFLPCGKAALRNLRARKRISLAACDRI